MKFTLSAALCIASPWLLVACSKAPEPAAPPVAPTKAAAAHAEQGVAWQTGDVDAVFAAAKATKMPVFLYWGAKWCPPCNQVKATLFNRQDFIERSRAFVPVYVDGDSPGAQKIGARFKVSGYPTMVLFTPQGQEVTRLPGEVEPVRYTQVLTLGMNAARPVSAVLADALAKPATLSANDWRLLAFYSWDTDHQQVIAKDRLPIAVATLDTGMLHGETLLLIDDIRERYDIRIERYRPVHEAVIAFVGRHGKDAMRQSSSIV